MLGLSSSANNKPPPKYEGARDKKTSSTSASPWHACFRCAEASGLLDIASYLSHCIPCPKVLDRENPGEGRSGRERKAAHLYEWGCLLSWSLHKGVLSSASWCCCSPGLQRRRGGEKSKGSLLPLNWNANVLAGPVEVYRRLEVQSKHLLPLQRSEREQRMSSTKPCWAVWK